MNESILHWLTAFTRVSIQDYLDARQIIMTTIIKDNGDSNRSQRYLWPKANICTIVFGSGCNDSGAIFHDLMQTRPCNANLEQAVTGRGNLDQVFSFASCHPRWTSQRTI